jgi:hypothetical protein
VEEIWGRANPQRVRVVKIVGGLLVYIYLLKYHM